MDTFADFFADYARELILASLVIATFWLLKRAVSIIRNWRTLVAQLAESKKAKAHKRLTSILIQAVSGSPIIVSHAIPMAILGVIAFGILAVIAGIAVTTFQAWGHAASSRANAEKALAVLRSNEPVEEPVEDREELLEGTLHGARSIELAGGIAFGVSVIMLLLVGRTVYQFVYQVMPDHLLALPMSIAHEARVNRLTAIATKDEARLLVGLEQNVTNEESLHIYLTFLRKLAKQYDFEVSSAMAQWLEAQDRKA